MASFSVTAESGGARCGSLHCSSSSLATPAFLVYTRGGAPVHLTHDMLATLPAEARALGLNAVSFLGDNPPAATVAAAGGAAAFAGLPGCTLFALPRDPVVYDAPLRRATDAGVQVAASTGVKRVTAADYASALAAARVDFAVAIADEVAATERQKRQRTAVERTGRWLRELRAAAAASGASAAIFASLQGGNCVEERTRAATDAVALQPPVAGFSLGGLGTGEAPEERPALLAASLAPLPPAAPRHVAGLGAPEEVLQCAAAGVDLFDGAYPHVTTQAGCALTFACSAADVATPGAGDGTAEGGDGFKINLRAPCFTQDFRPLLPGCTCFACANHTRCVTLRSAGIAAFLQSVHSSGRMCTICWRRMRCLQMCFWTRTTCITTCDSSPRCATPSLGARSLRSRTFTP
jgi:tRNA-guanine family transglycosylase